MLDTGLNMVWKVEFSTGARRQLRKLDKQHARRILKFLHDRVSVAKNPRFSGKPLKGERYGVLVKESESRAKR